VGIKSIESNTKTIFRSHKLILDGPYTFVIQISILICVKNPRILQKRVEFFPTKIFKYCCDHQKITFNTKEG